MIKNNKKIFPFPKPVEGVHVLLPHRSGTLSSSPMYAWGDFAPAQLPTPNPHVQWPWGLSHRLLQFAILGVNPFFGYLLLPYRLHHQWLLELRVLWNTIFCSSQVAVIDLFEDSHSRKQATQFRVTSPWKHILVEMEKKERKKRTINSSSTKIKTISNFKQTHEGPMWSDRSWSLVSIE